ncbi:hypothetical protein XELAEV_18021795mg [Xenopus laevis]|uniref:Uncharacterized protein n=1 Tax=Xenopus laevis TaxID=8355 RepID=A0A974D210_XENLA|nr:hypothetical protein XELAEV_18021795mg [Xenopus laevis]
MCISLIILINPSQSQWIGGGLPTDSSHHFLFFCRARRFETKLKNKSSIWESYWPLPENDINHRHANKSTAENGFRALH